MFFCIFVFYFVFMTKVADGGDDDCFKVEAGGKRNGLDGRDVEV